ncbi:MAG: ABC transporter ATP-binding protein [Firmicutes bacterium]|nr:ABC transporter ATP-binding protein [Bacillota bacterium]
MIKKLLKSVREYKKTSLLTPLFMLGEVLMEVLIPFFMAKLLDKGIELGDMNSILYYGICLIVCAIFSLIFGMLSARFASISSNGFAKNLRHDVYYKVQEYSFKNIDKYSTSSIITRLTTDISNVQNSYQMSIRMAVRAPLMFLFSLIMAFTINSKISLIFLIIVPILFGFLILIAKIAHPYFEKVFKTYDEINNVVKENVNAIRVVKSYVQEKTEINKFSKVSEKIYNLFTKAEKMVCSNSALMDIAIYTAIILVSFLGAKAIVAGTMTTGELASLFTYSMSILSSLMMLSMIYVMMIISLPSMKRVVELLDEKSDLQSPKAGINKVKDGSIEFKDVDFSYVGNVKKLSLKDVNLKIESGQTIGIIGSTGSSKSTLVNLIPRLYDTTVGEVLVGGKNVKEYDLETLRNEVSMVLQKNVLFSGTIKDNLLWGNEHATDEEIDKACDIAQASEFIAKLPGGLDYYIEQGATNVSGGQKQRLCIARALLKNPKIIIFDDSTSACDTVTDAKIREGLQKWMPNVTKIIIAQRIASVEDADKVIIMDEGRILDFDTPQKLLKTSKIYKEIYNSQKKGVK